MTKPRKQKRPPERSCPRGAKDNSLFRERVDARRAARPFYGSRRGFALVSEAYRQHPCQQDRFEVRRNASRGSRSQVQTNHVVHFVRFRARG
jgi:hypothetical protein